MIQFFIQGLLGIYKTNQKEDFIRKILIFLGLAFTLVACSPTEIDVETKDNPEDEITETIERPDILRPGNSDDEVTEKIENSDILRPDNNSDDASD